METKALVGLIDTCVSDFDSDGLSELVTQLSATLPVLIRDSSKETFELLVQSARLITFSKKPDPINECVNILLTVSAAHMPRGLSHDAIGLIERAMDLAEDHGLKSELRRACNFYSLFSTDAGNPARGIEYAIRAANLARELKDEPGIASAYGNMTAALYAMGLYRETISVALRVIKRFKDTPQCDNFVAIARANMANAALAIHHYTLSAASAKEACESMGLPKDAHGLLNRIASEGVWLKSAIGMNDNATATDRVNKIRNLSNAFKSPRIQLNHDLAEAAYEIYQGDLTIAVAKLLELEKHSKAVPGLYRDNLMLLVRAYEKGNDHAGALLYLGKLVDHLGQTQITAVSRSLNAIRERTQTYMPGKDDARAIIQAIQRKPGSRTSESDAVPESVYREAFERLAVAAELREDVLGRHAYRVGKIAGLIAMELGYGDRYSLEVEQAARLHDIGKLGIPDALFMKPAALSKAERTVMQKHTIIGANILKQCAHPAFRMAEEIALAHHEKWDGTGYPYGLRGEAIPETARVTALADVYDALTHVRPYKHAWTHEEAITWMRGNVGTHFEPQASAAFFVMIERLRHEQGNAFDDYLASAGNESSFIRARDEMREMIGEIGSNMFDRL